MLYSRFTLIFLAVGLSHVTVCAQVNIIPAPANFEFVDIGYDATSDEVAIVGHVNEAGRPATVFEPNAANDGFTTQTLANLFGQDQGVLVNAISADASRIAGFSVSPNAFDIEGATWLRSDPNSATGIGILPNAFNRSSASGAWRDGVVGSSGADGDGSSEAVSWSITSGIEQLPGTQGSFASAVDATLNGDIIVGQSSHESLNGAAYYWDDSGIHRLDDNIPGSTLILSSATSISPNGNCIGGNITAIDSIGNFILVAVVWEGPERALRILEDGNGDPILGSVNDVSDLGFVVGAFFDSNFNSFGFIWSPEFDDGVQLFEDWLAEQSPGATLPFASADVSSIATGNGKAFFTVAGALGEFAFVDVTIDGSPVLVGDFDNDGDVDADDIDFYNGNLEQPASFNPELDLDNDGTITLDDHDQHVMTLVQTSNGETGALIGDVNLDGAVDVLNDAFPLVGSLGTDGPLGYADGDLNANGTVDVLGDAFRLVANLGLSNAQ